MTRNMLIGSLLVITAIVGASYYAMVLSRDTEIIEVPQAPQTEVEETNSALVGSVVSVSEIDATVLIETTSTIADKEMKKTYTARIDPKTRILRSIVQKNASGEIEKQMMEEANIVDLKKGTTVTVNYSGENNGVLSGIYTISFKVDSNIDDYIRSSFATEKEAYIESRLASVDVQKRTLSFNTYGFGGISTTTQTLTLDKETPVYKVDNNSRIKIVFARTTATLQDLKPGDAFFFIVEKRSYQGVVQSPLAIIIVNE